jgi:hypothetical protein
LVSPGEKVKDQVVIRTKDGKVKTFSKGKKGGATKNARSNSPTKK